MITASKYLRSWACLFALLFGLVAFPDSTPQWQATLLLGASLLLMVWSGHLVIHKCAPEDSLLQETLFLKASLGQIALLLVWALASPVIFLAGNIVAIPSLLSIVAVAFFAATLAVAKSARSSFVASFQASDPARLAFLVFAGACLAKLCVYYSVRAGALGLDTHQHIYFTADLLDAGYMKLAAGSTDWLERYPKGLHALAALWAAPGFGDHIGVFVKVMPALQLLLVVFSVAELCAILLRRLNVSRIALVGWWLAVAVGVGYMFFRGTRFVYPANDLNSTARLSSAAVLFLPALAGCLPVLHSSKRAMAVASMALPLAGALAVKFNPSLSVAFIAVSIPLWAAVTGRILLRSRELRPSAFWGFVIGTLVGIGLLITDPFYLALLAAKSDLVATLVRTASGLAPLPTASIALPVSAASLPAELLQALWRNLLPHGGFSAAFLPESPMIISAKLTLAMRSLIWSSLGLWIFEAAISRRSGRERFDASTPAVIQIALLLANWANGVLGRAVAEAVGTGTIEASVLSTYARDFSNMLVLFSMPMHFVLSLTLLCVVFGRFMYSGMARPLGLIASIGLIVYAISLRWWPIPEAPPAEKLGWWRPVKEAQIDAFQDLERKVPPNAVLIARATAAMLNDREGWILPVGESTAYLPFARRQYLFNVRLGAGYTLTFDDLNNAFCKGTPITARKFLRDHSVDYLFTVDPPGTTPEQVLERTFCGIEFSELGLVYPPYATASGGLAIYELRPDP